MRKTFTYRIYLTNGQRRILERQLEECRWVYNETLAERRRAYEERGVSLRLYDTQAMLPVWKAARPSLTRVHSQVLQDVQVRVDRAFQAFFRRVQAGEHPGYPRYKGKGRYDSITCPPYGNGVRLDGERLILSKVGAVHVVLHRPLEGTPKTVTIRRSATGKWYACFSCVVDAKPLPPADAAVGIDMGLESFLVRSDGKKEPNPQFYRPPLAFPPQWGGGKRGEGARSSGRMTRSTERTGRPIAVARARSRRFTSALPTGALISPTSLAEQ